MSAEIIGDGSETDNFPGLEDSLSTLDLLDETSRGHLISGRLGTLPVEVRMSAIEPEEVVALVDEFNQRTGLSVVYDAGENELKYD